MSENKTNAETPKKQPGGSLQESPSSDARGSEVFGRKLRAVRKNVKHMTLQEVADLSEISTALLSQIERGLTSPSLRTVAKLQLALQLPYDFFFDNDPPHQKHTESDQDPDFVCRSDDRPLLDLGPNAPSQERLHHGHSKLFYFSIVILPAHESSGPGPLSYPGEKCGYVLEGTVQLTVNGKTALLNPGDSFLFDGMKPHSLHNPGDQTTKLIWVIAKPQNDLTL